MWVKICGLRSRAEVEWAAAAGADAVGFVLAPSRRQVSPQEVAAWCRDLPVGLERVGVFLERRVEALAEMAEQAQLTTLQLHGGEPVGEVGRLAAYRLIRVAAVATGERPPCPTLAPGERLLLDRRQGEQAGGTGLPVDWNLAAAWARRGPLILAGGLAADNLEAARLRVAPYGVDVSSGVETNGRKDPVKIEAFLRLAKKGGIASDGTAAG